MNWELFRSIRSIRPIRNLLKRIRLRTWISLGIIAILTPLVVFNFQKIVDVLGALGGSSTDPVAHWAFDEGADDTCPGGSNDACDSSGNGNDGAFGATTAAPSWQTEDKCVSGKCLYFDGSDDTTNMGDIDITSEITISAWVRTGTTANQQLIRKTNSYQLIIYDTGIVRGLIGSGTNWSPSNAADGTTVVTDNKWHHVAMTHSDTTNETKVYVDGVLEKTTTVTTDIGTNDTNLMVAHSDTGYFKGFLDEVKLFDSALTADQIKAEYAGGAAVFGDKTDWLSDGLVGYWKMDEASGTTVADASGNGNNGTLTNAQETGTSDASGNTTTTLVDTDSASLSTTDDAYNGMILYITDDAECALSADQQRLISDYDGTTKTFTVTTAYSADLDSCDYEVRHQIGGKYGNGIAFDGEDEYAQAGDFDSAIFTVSVWYKTSTQEDMRLFDTPQQAATIRIHSNDLIYLQLREYDGDYLWMSANPQKDLHDGEWHHLVYIADGSKFYPCLDGVCYSSSAGSYDGTNYMTQAGATAIRFGDGSNGNYTGTLDEVRVYNRVLSPSEVKDLYEWAPGPVGYWKMDESVSGDGQTLADSSGNGNDGTSEIGSNGTGMDCTVTGKYGKACDFDGTDDYINVGDPASGIFDFSEGQNFTITGWFYRETSNTHDYVLAKDSSGGSGSPGYIINIGEASDTFTFSIDDIDGNEYMIYSDSKFTSASWNHFAVTWDDSSAETSTIYINGKEDRGGTSGTFANIGSFINTENLFIGAESDNQQNFDGKLDEIKIYNYARTQEQIIEDMNAGHPTGGSPIGTETVYWALDEQQGGTAHDTVQHSDGTITGASWLTQSSCKVNGCLGFDAADEAVTIATASDSYVDFNGSEEFSASAWVYPTTMPGSGEQDAIIAKWDATSSQRAYRLYLENDDADATGNFEVEIYDESTDQTIRASGATDLVSENTWYHVAFTFNGGQAGAAGDLKLYVDGVYKAQNSTNASFLGLEDRSSDFTVGEYDTNDTVDTNTAFTGYIDEVKVYSSALTDSQVGIDMTAGSAAAMGGVLGAGEAADLEDGAGEPPIAEWKFDEKTGTDAFDTSGNGNTGTLTCNGGGCTDPTWTSGKYGSAVSFDGVDDYINLTTNRTDTDFTMSAWIKTNSTTTAQAILAFSEGWIQLNVGNNGTVYFGAFDNRDGTGAYHSFLSAGSITTNRWYHLTVTATGNTVFLYIDGVYVAQATNAGSAGGAYTTPMIGGGGSLSLLRPFDGLIDAVKVYDYARTPAQIAYDYNRGGPVGHWQFDECSGTTANDAAGSNNGTITAGPLDQTSVGDCSTSANTMWYNGASGKRNSSLNFDGDDDYVEVADSDALSLSNGSWSAFAWVNIKGSLASTVKVVVKGATNYALGLQGQAVDCIQNSTSVHGGAILTSLNTWYFIGCTYDGTTLRSYLNAVQQDSDVIGTVADSNSALRIGTNLSDGQRVNGQIDDVRIYNYALSAAQVKKVYNEGAVRFGAP